MAQTPIGYTNGNFDRADGVRLASGTTQRAAIRIPAAKLVQLAGAQVTAVNGVFGTRNISSVTFFITADLDGSPLYEQQLSSFSTQWKEYRLTTPFTLAADRDLYFGYTITCDEAYTPLAFDRQYAGPGCVYGYDGAGWSDLSSTTLGNLNLQLMVVGVPEFTDASVRLFPANGFYKAGQEYSFQGQLFNFGTRPVTSFKVVYSVDGEPEQAYEVNDVNIPSGSAYGIDISGLTTGEYGEKSVSVSVVNVNGNTDTYVDDNTRTQQMFFYPAGMERSFLIENFTGQSCGNCPMGHVAMEDAVERCGESVVQVSYHSGFQPDAFTMKEDAYYESYFGVEGAPSFMVNRFANPNVDATKPPFPLSSVTSATTANILDCIQQQAAVQPYVGVYVNTGFDNDTRRLTGDVTVVTYRDPEISNPGLTLLLMQDSIVGPQASYTTGMGGSNYVHRHVFRGCLNGTFGESLELEPGSAVTVPIDYTLPDSIVSTYYGDTAIAAVPDNMYLVAIVSNNNADDITDCVVLNCAAVKFGSATVTGITETSSARTEACARLVGNAGALRAEGDFDSLYIYNVGGKLVRCCSEPGEQLSLMPGVYVTRAVKDGASVTAKCVVAR